MSGSNISRPTDGSVYDLTTSSAPGERAVGNNLERKKEITAVKIIFILTEKENGSSFRALIQSTSSGTTLLKIQWDIYRVAKECSLVDRRWNHDST
jgi:hypothetical protein